jgi:hypothetical protein
MRWQNRLTPMAQRKILMYRIILATLAMCMNCWTQTPSSGVQEFAPGIVSTGKGFTVTFSPSGHDVYFTARDETSTLPNRHCTFTIRGWSRVPGGRPLRWSSVHRNGPIWILL